MTTNLYVYGWDLHPVLRCYPVAAGEDNSGIPEPTYRTCVTRNESCARLVPVPPSSRAACNASASNLRRFGAEHLSHRPLRKVRRPWKSPRDLAHETETASFKQRVMSQRELSKPPVTTTLTGMSGGVTITEQPRLRENGALSQRTGYQYSVQVLRATLSRKLQEQPSGESYKYMCRD